MPLIYFSRISENREEFFFARDLASTTYNSSSDFSSKYEKLPDNLKSCLDYCSFATFKGPVDKDKLVRLLLAEDLVQQIPGKIIEQVAETNLQDLISLGMLCEEIPGIGLEVEENYKEMSLVRVQEKDFVSSAADCPVFALIYDDGKDIPPNFRGLQVRSLFIVTNGRRSTDIKQGLSRVYMESVCELQSLVVLDLEGIVENLPDGIGNSVNLRYLSLYLSGLDEFPKSLFTLQELQTLDIRGCRLGNWHELPVEALKLKKLRHLLMSHNTDDCEVKVPEGFGSMVNLHTCDGVYGGGGIAKELGNLTRLCKLGVKRLANDHSDELSSSISKMAGLVSLSLEAEGTIIKGTLFPEMEQFSPPWTLRNVNLVGGLVDIPNWLLSIGNLTTLSLSYSRLSENQISVLQSLPKLKSLRLHDACSAKYMSKGFCGSGGFKELETLEIGSRSLVEWSEIVDGVFPSLRFLTFSNCVKLMFLPEGLQNVSTLERLSILPVYTEIARRLNGEESYKIKHIKEVILYEFPSALLQHFFAIVPTMELE